MTIAQLQELSKAVAAKYGIHTYTIGIGEKFGDDGKYWLHNDSGRCFDLAVGEGLEVDFDNNGAATVYWRDAKRRRFGVDEMHSDHNGNKQQAARVAVLKALLAKGE